ncbi:MAG: HEPN domain-containing protein [Candidatus Aenigmarchaeota archaeon]|nr:HEPN domain-containing protein [Candidatus Aenigmarchaeota archaeon]
MDTLVELYVDRAQNEIELAKSVFKISQNTSLKSQLGVNEGVTFYSAVISHSYYAIFYSAKAVLLLKGIKTRAPEEHRKTLVAFEKELVNTGYVDVKLLEIYKKLVIEADTLLEIFSLEKSKRGKFTYHKIAQANEMPAKESIENAKVFFKNINAIVEHHETSMRP